MTTAVMAVMTVLSWNVIWKTGTERFRAAT